MKDNAQAHSLEDWEPCDGGELRQVVWRVKTDRRNRDIVRIGGVGVILLLCTFAATLVWQQANQSGYDYGGITCKEVESHLPAYKEDRLDDRQLVKRIRVHLAECPHCGPLYEKMSQSSAVSKVSASHLACDCEFCTPPAPCKASDEALFAAGPTR